MKSLLRVLCVSTLAVSLHAPPLLAQASPAAECSVPSAADLTSRVEKLEREILLTNYAAAVEGLRRLQQEMTCMQESPEVGSLSRLFVDLGVALHRMGLTSDGDEAFATAAGIDPSAAWNESFAPSLGLRYYKVAGSIKEGPRVQLVTDVPPGYAWYVDGRLQTPGRPAELPPGWHFIQVAGAQGRSGRWFNLRGEVRLDLGELAKQTGGQPLVVAAPPEGETPSGWRDRTGGGAGATAPAQQGGPSLASSGGQMRTAMEVTAGVGLAGGAALLSASLLTAAQANDVYDGLTAETAGDYDTEYLPLVDRTNQLRAAGGVIAGVGVVAAVVAVVLPAEMSSLEGKQSGLSLRLYAGGAGVSGRF